VASFQKITSELGDLPAPAQDKASVESIMTKLEAGLKKAEAKPIAVLRIDPFEKAAEAARAYGFSTCNL
jgi:hypothetical protein